MDVYGEKTFLILYTCILLVVSLVLAIQCHWTIVLGVICFYLYYYHGPERKNKNSKSAVFIIDCSFKHGYALARTYSELGYKVFAGCPDPKLLNKPYPPGVFPVYIVPTNSESVNTALDHISGRLDDLGVGLWAIMSNMFSGIYDLSHYEPSERYQLMEENILGIMRVSKAFLPIVKKRTGCIILMSFLNDRKGYFDFGEHSVRLSTLVTFADCLVNEANKHGIQVCPFVMRNVDGK